MTKKKMRKTNLVVEMFDMFFKQHIINSENDL